MMSTLISFTSLFAGVFSLLTGIGLLGTHLSLRMAMEGYSSQIAGLILSAYFLGNLIGSLVCHRLIKLVGHIQSFAAFAAVATAIVMLHGLYMSAITWGILRFLMGMTTMGLYMTIESWLNERTTSDIRGRIFAMYMVISYLAVGSGQLLLNVADVKGPALFNIAGFLLALCLVPVVTTRSVHPELPEATHFNLLALLKQAPMGMLGCLASGLLCSAFYSMGPVFGSQIDLTVTQLSLFMTVTIFGGVALQFPVGAIADRFDRTNVLISLAIAIAIISLIIIFLANTSIAWLLPAMVLFGGLMFTIYPVSVARTHDLFEAKDVVSVSSALLLFYGIGATLGPITCSVFMGYSKSPYGFFAYCGTIGGIYAAASLFLKSIEKVSMIPTDEHIDFMPMRNSSPVAMSIDPRGEETGADSDQPSS